MNLRTHIRNVVLIFVSECILRDFCYFVFMFVTVYKYLVRDFIYSIDAYLHGNMIDEIENK